MGRIKIPYVECITAKGRDYRYYRRDGTRWGSLDGEAGSVEFAASYERAKARYEGRHAERFLSGSFGALVYSYLRSAEFKTIGERTKVEYTRHLDAMRERWRDLPVALLERRHVLEYRDAFADKPSVGNARIKVLKRLLSFAVDRGMVQINPVVRVGKMQEGQYAKWPEAAIIQFRESKPEPEIRWAFEMALYTGQRRGDLLRMLWSQFDGQEVELVQHKTKERLRIPVHPELKTIIDGIPRRAAVILTTPTGRAWTCDHFSRAFREATAAAGIEGYVFHGLRKTAAVRLSEAGCPTREIMAITGHRTLKMIELYTREVDQKRLATTAIKRLIDATGGDGK